jgi:fatty-acid desaturase
MTVISFFSSLPPSVELVRVVLRSIMISGVLEVMTVEVVITVVLIVVVLVVVVVVVVVDSSLHLKNSRESFHLHYWTKYFIFFLTKDKIYIN